MSSRGTACRLSSPIQTLQLPTMPKEHARLTVLLDIDRKRAFEEVCAAEGTNPSEVVRSLIARYLADDQAEPSLILSKESREPKHRQPGSDYTPVNIGSSLTMELKTARLTVLIDPTTKRAFEVACNAADMTPSQVVRRLIREFMDARAPRRPVPLAKKKPR